MDPLLGFPAIQALGVCTFVDEVVRTSQRSDPGAQDVAAAVAIPSVSFTQRDQDKLQTSTEDTLLTPCGLFMSETGSGYRTSTPRNCVRRVEPHHQESIIGRDQRNLVQRENGEHVIVHTSSYDGDVVKSACSPASSRQAIDFTDCLETG
ncbi:hypothetical protein MTO96_049750 [Rhipicephalus appendiculatus]